MQRQTTQWLIPVLLAIGVAGVLWYYRLQVSPPPPSVAPPSVTVPEEAPPSEPRHLVSNTIVEPGEKPALVPMPSLHESDAYFRLGIVDIFGESMEQFLANSGIIERIVATVDSLPRAEIPARILPLTGVTGQFQIGGQDESGEFHMSPGNFSRYEELVDLSEAVDLNEAMELYRRFYPLFQSAYVALGYPDGYFNDRLVEVVDHLLSTPKITGPIKLVRPHVLYEFSDPELEALSGGQKLLLRIGSEQQEKITHRLEELRAMLTTM